MIYLIDLKHILHNVETIKLVRVYQFPNGVHVTKTSYHASNSFFSICNDELQRLHVVSVKPLRKGKFEIMAIMSIYETARFESFEYEE